MGLPVYSTVVCALSTACHSYCACHVQLNFSSLNMLGLEPVHNTDICTLYRCTCTYTCRFCFVLNAWCLHLYMYMHVHVHSCCKTVGKLYEVHDRVLLFHDLTTTTCIYSILYLLHSPCILDYTYIVLVTFLLSRAYSCVHRSHCIM